MFYKTIQTALHRSVPGRDRRLHALLGPDHRHGDLQPPHHRHRPLRRLLRSHRASIPRRARHQERSRFNQCNVQQCCLRSDGNWHLDDGRWLGNHKRTDFEDKFVTSF